MAFTVDLTTPIGQCRFEMGDAIENDGVMPGGRNFTDAQIQYLLTKEGNHIGRTKAAMCEILAREWNKEPNSYRMGPEGKTIKTSEYWRLEAKILRMEHGRNVPIRRVPQGTIGARIYPAGANPADE
ncbi:MAG: hypothetical protein KC421_04235 [Anaerolineales bacterium]|nr:hypothetical protein [Anaerolineales bacterium]